MTPDGTLLSPLRTELVLYTAPQLQNGSPSWVLYDPIRHEYFQIEWPTFEILCRWGQGSIDKICKSINCETVLDVVSEDVQGVAHFLISNELLQSHSADETKELEKREIALGSNWLKTLLHSYLFFRIPLWNPNNFLGKSLWTVTFLGTKFFRNITILICILGLWQVGQQFDVFTATVIDFYNFSSIWKYLLTIIILKFIHELAHAYAAKKYGANVPAMGIALIILFPVAYTDVNDVWKMPKKQQRLIVGAAGIIAEIYIAAWATFFWVYLPDGGFRTAMFLVATTTWVSTVIINASPFLRFDGYFLLMDWVETPNLHQRSFTLARWWLRKKIFGLKELLPETTSEIKFKLMVLFAHFVWAYRLIVFLGIAVLVFYKVPKPLGPTLALLEIYWFIGKPIKNEISVWFDNRKEIMNSKRTLKSLLVITAIAGALIYPWDKRVKATAILSPLKQEILVLQSPAQLVERTQDTRGLFAVSETLATFKSQDLRSLLEEDKNNEAKIDLKINLSTFDEKSLALRNVMIADLDRAQTKTKGTRQQINQLTVKAPFEGKVHWFEPDFSTGDWVGANEPLGTFYDPNQSEIVAYVSQNDLSRISINNRANFYPSSDFEEPIELVVSSINVDATRVIGKPVVASVYGGDLSSKKEGEQVVAEDVVYAVSLIPTIQIRNVNFPEIVGSVVIYGEPKSWLLPYWTTAVAVFRREFGF